MFTENKKQANIISYILAFKAVLLRTLKMQANY